MAFLPASHLYFFKLFFKLIFQVHKTVSVSLNCFPKYVFLVYCFFLDHYRVCSHPIINVIYKKYHFRNEGCEALI